MRRAEDLSILSAHRKAIDRFEARSIARFDSVARDEADPERDANIRVDFDQLPTPDQYRGLKFFLEDTLGTFVDLASVHALKPAV